MLLSLDVLSFISTLDRKDRNLNRLHLVIMSGLKALTWSSTLNLFTLSCTQVHYKGNVIYRLIPTSNQ